MAPFLRILGIDDPYGNQNNHNNPCILRHLCLLSGMFPGFEMTFCWAILPFQVGGGVGVFSPLAMFTFVQSK